MHIVDHNLLDVVLGFIQSGKQVSLALDRQFYVLQFAVSLYPLYWINWQNILNIACLHLT